MNKTKCEVIRIDANFHSDDSYSCKMFKVVENINYDKNLQIVIIYHTLELLTEKSQFEYFCCCFLRGEDKGFGFPDFCWISRNPAGFLRGFPRGFPSQNLFEDGLTVYFHY